MWNMEKEFKFEDIDLTSSDSDGNDDSGISDNIDNWLGDEDYYGSNEGGNAECSGDGYDVSDKDGSDVLSDEDG